MFIYIQYTNKQKEKHFQIPIHICIISLQYQILIVGCLLLQLSACSTYLPHYTRYISFYVIKCGCDLMHLPQRSRLATVHNT